MEPTRRPLPDAEPVRPAQRSQTLTLLFTDLEGSTPLVQRLGDSYPALLETHHAIIRTAVETHGGSVVETAGDGVLASFPRAADAVRAAVAGQRALGDHPWPDDVVVRVRMGIHTGVVTKVETGYAGVDLHRAARICDVAWGGQILLSRATRALVDDGLPAGIELRDLGEYRLKGLSASTELHQVVADGLPGVFPPLRILRDMAKHNLPTPLTSFVGRLEDVEATLSLLSEHRLVTLTGVGGVGKTRLGVEVARRMLDEIPDGVWRTDLAPVTADEAVVDALAVTLGLRADSVRPTIETIGDALDGRTCLLVLDNCEHLVDPVAALTTALLSRCGSLRVLATSREGLAVDGEVIRVVAPLDLPDGSDETTDEIGRSEAVQLFLARAHRADPSFEPTETELTTIARICRRLDGIPLAIELAAARLRSRSVEQLSAGLDDRFKLITGGARTALPRHRALRATLEWSHDLLDHDERSVFRRAGVFPDAFGAEAGEEICASDDVPPDQVADVIDRLVDKSLLTVERRDGSLRYRMLGTVREFARVQLETVGETGAVRDAHAAWVAARAVEAAPHLRGPEQRIWLDGLEDEIHGIRAALDRSVATGDAQTAATIAVSLTYFFAKRALSVEHERWLSRIRGMDALDPETELAVMLAIGTAGPPLAGDQLDAGYSFETTLLTARERGTDRDVALALTNLASRQIGTDPARAGLTAAEALDLARQVGEPGIIIDALYFRWQSARLAGDMLRARVLVEEALEVARQAGELWDVGWCEIGLGQIDRDTGDLDAAESHLRGASETFAEIGDPFGALFADATLGTVALRRGDLRLAERLFEDTHRQERRYGYLQGATISALFLTRIARLDGDLDRAHRWLEVARATRTRENVVPFIEEAAAVSTGVGDHIRAVRLFAAARAARDRDELPAQASWDLEIERVIVGLKEALSPETFADAWRQGAALDLAVALEMTGEPARSTAS